jgi:antitoxin component of MazEF toxin-antitoxin module
MSSQTVLKWGNSLAFRLPSAIARQLEVREGAKVTYRVHGRRLIIEPAEPALPEYTREDLRRAAKHVRKAGVRWGPPKGREVW